MLNKKEKHIFKAIFDIANGRETFLITPNEILHKIPFSVNVSRREFEDILKTLEYDGYLERIDSDKKGDKIYCLTLTNKGMGFDRELLRNKRTVYFKVVLTLATATLGVIVTKILSSVL